jgi:hypothetical protein
MDPVTKMLLDIALLGTLSDLDDEVARIRPVLVDLGLDPVKLDLTRAALMYARGTPKACVQTLEADVLHAEPANDIGRALLTAAMRQIGHADWRRTAESVMSTALDPIARNMAMRELAAA